ncbi:MAG TPA: aspartate aminotransferase family protein [Candidatus Hydrogenedentes bacterium]|nr:aspartate aminotransferase family protein [Candidatus Hydrogenedentota bacterium]
MIHDRSKALYERACRVTPGGVHSNVRLAATPVPLFYERGEGAHLWDVDGNEYIDYVMGQGPMLLGHTPRPVIEAVRAELDKGFVPAGQTELEVRAAELICELVPCAEMTRFNCTGSEAVMAAVRAARAYTGRPKVLRFEGHYHGWHDGIAWNYSVLDKEAQGPPEAPLPQASSAGQDPASGDHLLVLPWNDLALVEDLFAAHGSEIAAVICEPMMCNWCGILPLPGYLEGLRRCCDRHGVLLIFDEVITGFRLSLGGGQEYFGVTPDLCVLAKALGAGMAVSAVAGRADVMRVFVDGKTVHAGTYNANRPAMAGTVAALEMLRADGGAELRKAHAAGTALMEGLRALAEETATPLVVRGLPPVFQVSFVPEDAPPIVDFRSSLVTDFEADRRFWRALHERGVRCTARGLWFVSTAHSAEDVEKTLEIVRDALMTLRG